MNAYSSHPLFSATVTKDHQQFISPTITGTTITTTTTTTTNTDATAKPLKHVHRGPLKKVPLLFLR